MSHDEINNIVDIFNESNVRFFFIEALKIKFNCRRCDEVFLFNNKFHYHFKRYKKFVFKSKIFRSFKSKVFFNFIIKIIRSFALINFTSKFNFKFWRYVKLKININFFKSNNLITICIDFDCEFLLINRQCLIVQRLNYIVHVLRKSKFLKINEINVVFLFINKYISLNFVIFDNLNDKSVKICFIKHFYIVNNFKINILLNNNIFESKNMFVYVDQKKIFVDNCDNFVASLKIIIKNNNDERVKRIIRF